MRAWNRARLLWGYLTRQTKLSGLPVEYIAILLTVDWFLDRCRTTINVMGDVNVSCILDGRTPSDPPPQTL